MTNKYQDDLFPSLSKGDAIAFKKLMEIYYPVICHFSEKYTKDQAASEDIVSEAFMKVWQQMSNFDSVEGVRKFLYTVVRNSSLNFIRSEQRKDKYETAYSIGKEIAEEEIFRDIIKAETWAKIYQAVNELPPKMQEVLKMAYLHDVKNQEIADALNISVFTVKAHKQRALVLLKERLSSKDFLFLMLFFSLNG